VSAPIPSGSPAGPRLRWPGALQRREFRLLCGGYAVSLVGASMQGVAQPWLALRLTHSGLLVGVVLAVQYLPMAVAGPLVARLGERLPKRGVLLATRSAFAVPALLLFVSAETGAVGYGSVLAAALAWGLIHVVDVPARQALTVERVGRDDLMHARTVSSAIWHGAAVAGPVAAGFVIASLGLSWCFLINALSSAAVVAALIAMRPLPRPPGARGGDRGGGERGQLAGQVAAGAKRLRGDPLVASMVAVAATYALFAMQRLTLLPLFSADVLGAGGLGFGLLVASLGLGTMTAALALAVLFPPPAGRLQVWVGLGWSLALLCFSASRWLLLSLALLYLVGVCQTWFLSATCARIEAATPDPLRGGVTACYAQVLIAAGSIGAVVAGGLASTWGAPAAMATGAGIAGTALLVVRLLVPGAFTFPPPEPGDAAPRAPGPQ
jgi:MFS family permease